MPQRPQPAGPGTRALQALGLTVFFATALFLAALLVTWVAQGPQGTQQTALVVSTAFAVIGVVAMLVDGADLWMFGRRLQPGTVKTLRYVVFGAVLAALVASLFGRNSVLIIYMLPAMAIYLVISRRRPAPAWTAARRGGAQAGRRPGASGSGGSGSRSGAGSRAGSAPRAAKPRQRRGGKKRR